MNDTSPAARLMDVAIKIAHDAPKKKGQYVSHALVYWGDLTELRAALDAMDIEWRPKSDG